MSGGAYGQTPAPVFTGFVGPRGEFAKRRFTRSLGLTELCSSRVWSAGATSTWCRGGLTGLPRHTEGTDMPLSVLYYEFPATGTSGDDFMFGYASGPGTVNTLNGGDGDDFIMGDSQNFQIAAVGNNNGSMATAQGLGDSSLWSTQNNPLIADPLIPYTYIVVEATTGQAEYFGTPMTAGQTITVDIDFGNGSPIGTGGNVDLYVEILDSNGTVVAFSDDSAATDGGLGSFSGLDPYLTFTAATSGSYYIRVRPLGETTFSASSTFILNVSMTGHAVNATPIPAGADTLSGGNGDDLIVGQDGNDILHGGSGMDILNGGDGNDTLDGGTGGDTLNGGAGDDLVWYDPTNFDAADGGTGIDTLNTTRYASNLVYNLASGATGFGESLINFENVVTGAGNDTIYGSSVANRIVTGGGNDLVLGGDGDDVISGGDGKDELYGQGGNDTLADGGGVVAETLLGGIGDDTYIVSFRESSTIEYANEGIDTVLTTFSIFALQNNVENLTLTDNGTHGAGVGNALNNVITGGNGKDDLFGRDGDDTLDGNTGAANTLLGQLGNDTYLVRVAGDSVVEVAGQGTDTVRAFVSAHTLAANVENLIYAGAGTFIGVGNSGGNAIYGGAQADDLNGMGGDDVIIGGAGSDFIQGGSGGDQFRYMGGETGYDRIIDFVSGADKVMLNDAFWTQTGTVDFAQGAGAVATTGNSTFIHNTSNGMVYFDLDGNGAGLAVALCQLNVGQTLTASDFGFF
ncbi:MAG: calcium-binding protein [Caulobacteraceae bacterium]|nr:MAG: calcium-binding protein [Caulobacteraceae bacterium]